MSVAFLCPVSSATKGGEEGEFSPSSPPLTVREENPQTVLFLSKVQYLDRTNREPWVAILAGVLVLVCSFTILVLLGTF